MTEISIKRVAQSIKRRLLLALQSWHYARHSSRFVGDRSFSEAVRDFPGRDELYTYMHHYLHHLAPTEVRAHRQYFSQEQRGFGEDALHAMWYTLLREFRPAQCLEIGVYRGQVVTLWGLIAKLQGFHCEVHGISPFSPAGDQVSSYLAELDYFQDTLNSNRYFGLPDPFFLRAFSTDPSAVDFIRSRRWDLIYIDGNHDYEVALADYRLCRDALNNGGLLVMDDSSLLTDFRPPLFSFAGHPGPSRVVQELAMHELRFLGGVGHNNVFTTR